MIEILKALFMGMALICGTLFLAFVSLVLFAVIVNVWRNK